MPRLQRRQLLRASALLPLAGVLGASPALTRQQRALMGTRVQILAPGRADELAPAFAAAWAEMARLEALLSRYRADGPLAALAQSAGRRPLRMPAELVELLQRARAVSARSGGAFDVTVGAYADWHFEQADAMPTLPAPVRLAAQRRAVDWRAIEIDGAHVLLNRAGMRLDLGGIAKLPILEAGMQALRRQGLKDALIDGGGDVRAIGRAGERAWQVGLRDPLAPARLLGRVELEDGWVASSGDYERGFMRDGRRYHHILDPRSGEPSQGLRGLSLLGRDLLALNGLGPSLMVLGRAAGPALLPAGVVGVGLRSDGSRWQSPELAQRLRA